MNFKSISFYLSLFCFPISILAFINILYASYFDYFLSVDSYFITLIASLILGFSFYFFGKNGSKKINFIDQLILIIFVVQIIHGLFSLRKTFNFLPYLPCESLSKEKFIISNFFNVFFRIFFQIFNFFCIYHCVYFLIFS